MERDNEFVFFLDRKQEKIIGKRHRIDATLNIQYALSVVVSNMFEVNASVRVYFCDRRAYYRGMTTLDPAVFDSLVEQVLISTKQYLKGIGKHEQCLLELMPDNFAPSQATSDQEAFVA